MPSAHDVTIEGAIFAALAAAAGWFAGYILTGWREDRTKRLQLEIERASLQVKEFYAPLMALTDQLDTMVDEVLIKATKGKSGADYLKLTGLIYERFFSPIHEEINVILKTKVHLLEGTIPPPSFRNFFAHYVAQKAFWNLSALGEDVSNVIVPEYPEAFYDDVRSGYGIVVSRYESALQALRRRSWLFDADNVLIQKFRDRWVNRSKELP